MTAVLWVVLPVLIAVGAGLIALYLMQERMEVQLARERQSLAEARATIEAHRRHLDELDQLRDEAAKRRSFEDFLSDVRVERKHAVREKKMLFGEKKVLVVRERMFFRDLPLCGWIEHETPIEDGADAEKLARSLSVFTSAVRERSGKAPDAASRSAARPLAKPIPAPRLLAS